uniref:Tetratricopeptide SHNi-TPR domain-containing protein n=1 Tax=Astatotilapia calliptera TaxID=8154 RepID=A0A3P8PP92_ASTCA
VVNMEEANKLIGTGKKHLVMGKVVEAVSTLQEASGMLAKEFGDTADECGEAFFWYGKALLDLARMENSVLGNALEGVPEEEEEKPKDSNVESTDNVDEKTRDELRVQVYDAMAEKKTEDGEKVEGKQSEDPQEKTEGAEAGDKKENTEKVEGEAEKDNKNDESKSESKDKKEKSGEEVDAKDDSEPAAKEKEGDSAAAKKEKTAAKEEEPAEKMDSAAEEEEAAAEEEAGDLCSSCPDPGLVMAVLAAEACRAVDDEEVGNLQLAWEMLEVAKVIYKRKETKEAQLMAAQAHLKLGEVSAESGNYPQALEDFQECLKLQVKHLDSDSRLLAETRYQLGVTYSLNTQYSEAIESLKSSISIIKNRLDKLQEMLDKAEGPEALPEERKELEELKALLPEIQEKVEDATESLKTASAAVKDALVSLIKSTSTSNGNTSTAAVSDISHLVRKKVRFF